MLGRSPPSNDRPSTFGAETIEACRRGERRALDRVFRAEASSIERVIRRIVGSSADVEDLLQSALIATIHAFPRYRGEASVRTWMTKIAVRTAMAHLKHPDRRRRVPLEVVGEQPVVEASLTERTIHRKRLDRLEHHLEQIDVKKRTAFVLHVFEGHPIAEIAVLMGASETATKSRIFWARRELLRRARKDPVVAEYLNEAHE